MATTNQIKMKCLDCNLHFIVMSDNPEWFDDHRLAYCPECGSTRPKIVWQSHVSGFIYEHVPGSSVLVSMP